MTQLAEGRNDVVLRKNSGMIYNRVSKKTINLLRRGGTYIWRTWVWVPEEPKEPTADVVRKNGDDPGPDSDFTRQADTV